VADGKPLLFDSFEVLAAGGSAGTGTTYTLVDSDNVTLGNELETAIIEDRQQIINYFNQAIEIISYDVDDVLADSNIQTDSTIVAEKKIILNGATGSVDVTIDNVRITAHRPFNDDLTRDHVMVMAQKSATSGISVAAA